MDIIRIKKHVLEKVLRLSRKPVRAFDERKTQAIVRKTFGTPLLRRDADAVRAQITPVLASGYNRFGAQG
jgi:hypothetical protein